MANGQRNMAIILKSIKTVFSILLLAVMAACTGSTVEQDLAPQPIVSQTQPVTTPIADGTTNALTPQTAPTPSQNVTEAQLQQQANGQVQPTGLADVSPQTPIPSPTQQVASLDTSKAVTFLPFEGAPQSKASSLTRSLNSSAQAKGLSVLPTTRSGAKYRVKGYFSALNDGNGTLLVYVWDVIDGSGKRLHRINGRERTGTSRTDPWQAISDAEIERVAQDTTARLKTWVDKRS